MPRLANIESLKYLIRIIIRELTVNDTVDNTIKLFTYTPI